MEARDCGYGTHIAHLRLRGETTASESSVGSRSEPGFLAFYLTTDQWTKDRVTACSLGFVILRRLRFGSIQTVL